VLDLWLASDTVITGTPALQMLSYRTSLGKPVVGLERLGDPAGSFVDDGVQLGAMAAGAPLAARSMSGWRADHGVRT
jgi:hypothetical protein